MTATARLKEWKILPVFPENDCGFSLTPRLRPGTVIFRAAASSVAVARRLSDCTDCTVTVLSSFSESEA